MNANAVSAFNTLGNFLGDNASYLANLVPGSERDKAKKRNAKMKALYDSYNETFNGPGAQGEWGFHLPEMDYGKDVLMPLAMDVGKSILYGEGQLLAKGQEKIVNWFKNRNAAKDAPSAEIPEGQTDIKPGGLIEEPVAAAGSGNPDVENNMGMVAINNPVNMAFPGNLLKGMNLNPEQAASSAQVAMMVAKKGTKLIPRQK